MQDNKRTYIAGHRPIRTSINSFEEKKMSKQIWKYVGLLMVISLVLAACGTQQAATPQVVEVTKIVNGAPVVITTTPQPTENPYDDNAPITVWIDADRQPA